MGTKRCLRCGELGVWARDGRCTRCRRLVTRLREMSPARQAFKAERYGAEHRQARARWAEALTVASYPCARCGLPVTAESEWHLDHLEGGQSQPSHARCNTGARNQAGKGWTS